MWCGNVLHKRLEALEVTKGYVAQEHWPSEQDKDVEPWEDSVKVMQQNLGLFYSSPEVVPRPRPTLLFYECSIACHMWHGLGEFDHEIPSCLVPCSNV